MSWIPILLMASLAKAQGPYDNTTQAVFSYEVTPPLPDYGKSCSTQLLINQTFANSYGKPAYIHYVPPEACPDFTHVTAELYLSTFGYQYDRLMHLFKDGIEVWRPSTAEPVGRTVISKESKDLSIFTNLFKSEGLVEFSLDNILAGFNEGTYYTQLKLNFYNSAEKGNIVDDTDWFYKDPPTNFVPIVANQSTIYKTPAAGLISQLPRNTTRAALNVFASGNSQEEFWYTNDLGSDGGTRLIKVFIDGTLAGVADPFPVVYTGGLDPGLWQPLLGLKATDVPSYIIDLSPFLPWIWDHATNVEIAVGDGYNDTQGILSNWIIDASLLTWQSADIEGTGSTVVTTQTARGWPIVNFLNASVEREGGYYSHHVNNSALLDFVNTTTNTNVWSGSVSWSQISKMTNYVNETDTDVFVHQFGQGWSQSAWQSAADGGGNPPSIYERSHYYPIDVSLIQQGESYKLVSVNRSYDVNVSNNGATYWENVRQESVFDNNQFTSINDIYTQDYHRQAEAINGKVIFDSDPPSEN